VKISGVFLRLVVSGFVSWSFILASVHAASAQSSIPGLSGGGGNPATGLIQASSDAQSWVFEIASGVGALSFIVGGVLCYFGIIPKEWMVKVLVISGLIIIGPQIIKFIFSYA